jgi:hypothetical protein
MKKTTQKKPVRNQMSKIDKIETFARQEKWQVERTSNEQVKFTWRTATGSVTHVVTAKKHGVLRIESTPDRPLPPLQAVRLAVLPNPAITVAAGVPTLGRDVRISAARLSEAKIDELLVDAMFRVEELTKPDPRRHPRKSP